jgi:hypothetical protein
MEDAASSLSRIGCCVHRSGAARDDLVLQSASSTVTFRTCLLTLFVVLANFFASDNVFFTQPQNFLQLSASDSDLQIRVL